MKKTFTFLLLTAITAASQHTNAQTTIRIFDEAKFYGGYADTTVFVEPAPPDVLRLKTSLFSKKISNLQLAQIGTHLSMKVLAKPLCDNYDRAGHVSLALVPKGNSNYWISDTAVKRIEIARFITPFMNKNKTPDTVGYYYEINEVSNILRQKSITDAYDIWMELEIFGVSSAANTQISGCADRKDVWLGTVDLITDDMPAPVETDNVFIPLGNQLKFNNYQAGASDAMGTTEKTISFTLDSISYNTTLFLLTSNHGANSGGEEYNRRNHFVFIDGTQVMQYKPGFPTCEPYRVYNTQANGIYGSSPKTDAQWQSFSNWCPGAYIPTRVINAGTLQAGTHTFKITVPDAQFVGGEGNFPLSLYVQGKTKNTPIVDIDEVKDANENTAIYPNPAQSQIFIRARYKINEVRLYNVLGQEVYKGNSPTISVEGFEYGVYYAKIKFENNITVTKSFIKN